MFAAWGRFVYRRRWPVLAISGLLLVASAFIVVQGGKLQSGGFIETSESGRASRLIERELPRAGGGTFTLIFSSDARSGTSPEFRAAVDAALAPLRKDSRIATIVTPYDGTASDPTQLISKDGHAVAIDVAVKDDLATARDYYPELRALVRSDTLQVQATGVLAINSGFNEVLQQDLRRAETVSLPLALVLLLVVFGSIVAALGRSGMRFYQGTFLSSMGISGAIVVASAVFYGLTFLPALLAILGRNLGRGRVPIFQPDSSGTGWWHTIATAVMRRPLLVLVPIVAFILLLGSPFLHLRLANNDVTALPTHAESRAAFDRLVNEFPGGNQTHISVVVEYPTADPLAPSRVPGLVDYAKRIAALPNVDTITSPVTVDPRFGAAEYAALYAQPRPQLPPQLQALLRGTVGEHSVVLDVVTQKGIYSDEDRRLHSTIRPMLVPPYAECVVT